MGQAAIKSPAAPPIRSLRFEEETEGEGEVVDCEECLGFSSGEGEGEREDLGVTDMDFLREV